jgi:hypothetical protein
MTHSTMSKSFGAFQSLLKDTYWKSFAWKNYTTQGEKDPYLKNPLTQFILFRGVSGPREQLSDSNISSNSRKIWGMNQGSIWGRFKTKTRRKRSCATVPLNELCHSFRFPWTNLW